MSVSAHCVLTVVPFANDRQTVASGQSSAYFDKATMAGNRGQDRRGVPRQRNRSISRVKSRPSRDGEIFEERRPLYK